MNIRDISSTIRQWYSTTDWNSALATAAVASVFAVVGAMLADYTDVAVLVTEGYVSDHRTLFGTVFLGIPLGIVGAGLVLAADYLVGRYRDVRGLLRPLAHIGLPLGVFAALLSLASLFDADGTMFEALINEAGGMAWWAVCFAGASVGLWLRDRRQALPSGAVPGALAVAVVVLVASGSVVGMVVPSESDLVADRESDDGHGSVQNESLYVDGEAGPTILYPTTENRTEAVPLNQSAFACERPLDVTNYTIGPASRMVPAESAQEASGRITIQRITLDDGTVVPNRAWLTIDTPAEITHVRSVYLSGDDMGEVDRDTYPLNGDHEQYIKTEWGEQGVYMLVFATEDGTLHRYYAGVCASDPVEA